MRGCKGVFKGVLGVWGWLLERVRTGILKGFWFFWGGFLRGCKWVFKGVWGIFGVVF